MSIQTEYIQLEVSFYPR